MDDEQAAEGGQESLERGWRYRGRSKEITRLRGELAIAREALKAAHNAMELALDTLRQQKNLTDACLARRRKASSPTGRQDVNDATRKQLRIAVKGAADGTSRYSPDEQDHEEIIGHFLDPIIEDLAAKLGTAMGQNRKQDTALRVIRKRSPQWEELINSALTVGPDLVLDGERGNVDRLLEETADIKFPPRWYEAWDDLKAKLEAAEKEKDDARALAFTEAGRYAKHLRTVDMDGTAAAFNIEHWCKARGIHALENAREAKGDKT